MALSEEEDEEEDHMEATESQPLSGDEKWASRILIYIFKKAYCNCVYVHVWEICCFKNNT